MLITAIILAATAILLTIYVVKSVPLNKTIKQIDSEIRNLLTATEDETLNKDAMIDLYNKRAELDSDIIEFNKNMLILTVITLIVAVITVIAACILHIPV